MVDIRKNILSSCERPTEGLPRAWWAATDGAVAGMRGRKRAAWLKAPIAISASTRPVAGFFPVQSQSPLDPPRAKPVKSRFLIS
jgi:hypothetical protein